MVGGGEQHQRVGVDPCGGQCGNACRGCGIPANGLQNEVINCCADLLKLFGNEKAVAVIGEDVGLAKNGLESLRKVS